MTRQACLPGPRQDALAFSKHLTRGRFFRGRLDLRMPPATRQPSPACLLRRWLALAPCLTPLVATSLSCGSLDTPAQPTDAAGDGDADGSSGSLPCDDGGPLDLSGTWAAFMRFSVALESQAGGAVAVCPPDQIRQTSLLLLLNMNHAAHDATIIEPIAAVACWMELPTVTAIAGQCSTGASNLVTTQILAPPAMIAALPDVAVPPGSAVLSALQPGARWNPTRFTFTLGADPSRATLPAWDLDVPGCGIADNDAGRSPACEQDCVTDCDTLVDADHDGWPGVTAHVCGTTPDDNASKVECNPESPNAGGVTLQGRALIDFRVDPLFDGIARSSCEITGTVDAQVVYNIVGADIYLANAQISVASAIKSLPTFRVDSSNSPFRMIRVDGLYGAPDWSVDIAQASAACAAAAQHRNELL